MLAERMVGWLLWPPAELANGFVASPAFPVPAAIHSWRSIMAGISIAPFKRTIPITPRRRVQTLDWSRRIFSMAFTWPPPANKTRGTTKLDLNPSPTGEI